MYSARGEATPISTRRGKSCACYEFTLLSCNLASSLLLVNVESPREGCCEGGYEGQKPPRMEFNASSTGFISGSLSGHGDKRRR